MKKILLALALVFFGCSEKGAQTKSVQALKTGDIIELKSVNGGVKKLKRLKNGFEIVGQEDKLLMLDFFGTFCPPCQKEAANLTKIQADFSKDLVLIGLTSFEDVSDKYVVENFVDKFGAYYFIANSKQNEQIAKAVLKDIAYLQPMQLPFKVLLKSGKYQVLTDVWSHKEDTRFFIGDVGEKTIRDDLKKVLGR